MSKKIFDGTHFDIIIPIGYNCTIANVLNDVSLRGHSYPFDWVFVKMYKVTEYFKTDFKDFFLREKLVQSDYSGSPASEKSGIISRKERDIIYVHDGHYQSLKTDDDFYTMQKNKYNRRVERLYNNLNSNKKILFAVLDQSMGVGDVNNFLIEIKKKNFTAECKLLIFTSPTSPLSDICHDDIYVMSHTNNHRWSIGNFFANNVNASKFKKNNNKQQKYAV